MGANIGATYSDISVGGNNTHILGDAIASLFELGPGATITLFNYAHILGDCVTDGGAITLDTGASCAHKIMDPDSPDITLLGNAVDQEEVVDAAILCQTPTQTITSAIKLGAGKTRTITLAAGLNIVTTSSVTLGNSSVLTLNGSSLATVILETPGPISVGDSAKIVLQGGLKTQNVWISSTTEFVGFHGPANPPTTIIGNSGVLNGTIHGGETCRLGSNVTINGALICDYGISAKPNLMVRFAPATGLSLPNCISNDAMNDD